MKIKDEEIEDDEAPPQLERQESNFEASDASFEPSLSETVKSRKRAASTTLVNQAKPPRKNSNVLTTRDLHDDEVMDTTIGNGEDAVPKRSVKKVKRGGKKGTVGTGRTIRSDPPDNEQMEDEPPVKRKKTKLQRFTNEAFEDFEQDNKHPQRVASNSAKQSIKNMTKETAEREWKGHYPANPIKIPEDMTYVSVRYDVDKAYFEEKTAKVAWDCGLFKKDLVVGKEITLLYDNKPYKAKIIGFAPTEEECRKLTNAHPQKEQDAIWDKYYDRLYKNKEKEDKKRAKREEEENKRVRKLWDELDEREKRESREELNGKDENEEEADTMVKTTTRKARSRTRRTTIDVTSGRRRPREPERKSVSSQEYEHTDEERNEVKEQRRTKRRENDHHMHKKNSRAAKADANSVEEVESQANDDVGEQVHEMDTGDEPTVVFDLQLARIEREKEWADFEKRREEKEKKREKTREEKAKKEEEKREQRRQRVIERQQRELDNARIRNDEERRRIVKDGMGGDEAMLPPSTIRIPKRSSQDVKVEDAASADETTLCRVKMEPMETEEPPAPDATVVRKNSLFDKEESIDAKKSAIVQKKEDSIVTKRDEEDTVAKEISIDTKTAEKTSTNSDEGAQKNTDNLGSRLIAPKKEISFADAMWLQGEDVVVLSSDDEGEGKVNDRITTSNSFDNLKKEDERRLKDDRVDKEVAEDIRNTLDTMKAQAEHSGKRGRGDPRSTAMSYVNYAGAAAKTLAAREADSHRPYGWSQSSQAPVSGLRPSYMLQPFGASTYGLAPTSSFAPGPTLFGAGAHGMAPNPISTRTPVHVSFNPHPVGSTAFNDYLHQRGGVMNPLSSSSSVQSGRDDTSSSRPSDQQLQPQQPPTQNGQGLGAQRGDVVSSSSTSDAPLMQLQQNVMPSQIQSSSSNRDEDFTMRDDDGMDVWYQ